MDGWDTQGIRPLKPSFQPNPWGREKRGPPLPLDSFHGEHGQGTSLNISSFLQAWNHLSPSKYLVANLAAYSMHGQTFSCTPEQEVGGKYPIRTGEDALRLYNLGVNAHLNLMALVITTVINRSAAYGVLRSVKK